MKRLALIALFLAAGCTKEPAVKEAENPADKSGESAVESPVKAEKKNIEQAADEAAKLIEEETREEIDALDDAVAQ